MCILALVLSVHFCYADHMQIDAASMLSRMVLVYRAIRGFNEWPGWILAVLYTFATNQQINFPHLHAAFILYFVRIAFTLCLKATPPSLHGHKVL